MFTKRALIASTVAIGFLGAGAVATVAAADGDDPIRVRLSGYQEDPAPISTEAWGEFRMWVDDDHIRYRLRYAGLEGEVTQAHIHFAGRHQSGGISAWLCDTTHAPAPTTVDPPTCRPAGTVSGTIEPDDVVGPAAQGIEPGEFDELLDAIKAQTTYVNVHSLKYPAGELRSQLTFRNHR